MRTPLYLDTETFSPVNLKMQGTYRYAEEAEIIMWQYAIGDGKVIVDDELTPELTSLLQDDNYEIVIHNSNFDRTVIRLTEGIDIPTNRIFDTMACAMAHSLPAGLGELCAILGVEQDKSKDKGGKVLIKLFCCPQKVTRNQPLARFTKETHPKEWAQFRDTYGRLDIESLREVYKLLPRWNFKGFERELWELDQKINDRGVYVDVKLAAAAIRATSIAKREYDDYIYTETNGEVGSASQGQALIYYIKDEYGVEIKNLTAANVKALMTCGLPQELIDLLEVRLNSSKTSTAKYRRVVKSVCQDGRLKGLTQFCGAKRTGRFAGRLFQHQNLPRPTVKGVKLEEAIEALKGNYYGVESEFDTMEVCKSALRGIIVPPKGKKLLIADLSNIEGRKLSWLAYENWKVKAFRDFDKGIGHDMYNLAYSKAFGVPIDEVNADKGDMRQIGKVMELAFGFGGGVGAWLIFALAYGIDLEEMAKKAWKDIPENIIEESRHFLIWFREQGKQTYGLSDTAFIVCDSFKRMWRNEHPNIVAFWKELEQACIKAINNPGTKYVVGYHCIRKDASFLRIVLPSGRSLCYPNPKVEDGKISYMGDNQFTRKWSRISTYGGKLSENITQASSRDTLCIGLVRAEKDGYNVVLHTHDEIVAEVPDTDEYTVDGLIAAMTERAIWAIDLPLAAKGFSAYRYGKE